MEEHLILKATGDSLIKESKQILKGYGALYYKPIWKYLAKDKQEETMKEIIQGIAKSENT